MTAIGPPWTIERLVPGRDLNEVVEIAAASFSRPWTREMFLWEIQNSDVAHMYVLRLPAGGVAAFCSCWLIFDELHINNLAVRPEHRRRGLATALLAHVLREEHHLGARHVTLEVRRSNEAARQLYERLGFRVAGTRPGYYTDPVEDALILCRDRPDAASAGRPGTA